MQDTMRGHEDMKKKETRKKIMKRVMEFDNCLFIAYLHWYILLCVCRMLLLR
jgi:hypothetical protein